MWKNRVKITFVCFTAVFFLWFLLGYYCSWYLTSRRFDRSTYVPNELNGVDINLISDDGVSVSAWYIQGDSDKAVILLSGIGANRLSSVSRAKYYLEKGFTVMLPDLRGTGSSGGDVISFGWNESKDLKVCYKFLKNKKINKIAVHGCSLGAATIAYSLKEINDYCFIVLESCYDNIDQAFNNRVEKYHLPDFLYFPVRFFIERRIGAETAALKPEEFIKLTSSPVLIMAGDSEVQIKKTETWKLFNNCSSDKKKIYFFTKGKHEDLREKFKDEYIKILNDFTGAY